METNNNPYIFETPLIEGVICRRPNRFIMEVEVDGIAFENILALPVGNIAAISGILCNHQ